MFESRQSAIALFAFVSFARYAAASIIVFSTPNTNLILTCDIHPAQLLMVGTDLPCNPRSHYISISRLNIGRVLGFIRNFAAKGGRACPRNAGLLAYHVN